MVKENQYKVGDRVRFKDEEDYKFLRGKSGTVLKVIPIRVTRPLGLGLESQMLYVSFDEVDDTTFRGGLFSYRFDPESGPW